MDAEVPSAWPVPSHPVTPFQEKHMVESLDVFASNPAKTVLYYNMLNQGHKRGK